MRRLIWICAQTERSCLTPQVGCSKHPLVISCGVMFTESYVSLIHADRRCCTGVLFARGSTKGLMVVVNWWSVLSFFINITADGLRRNECSSLTEGSLCSIVVSFVHQHLVSCQLSLMSLFVDGSRSHPFDSPYVDLLSPVGCFKSCSKLASSGSLRIYLNSVTLGHSIILNQKPCPFLHLLLPKEDLMEQVSYVSTNKQLLCFSGLLMWHCH